MKRIWMAGESRESSKPGFLRIFVAFLIFCFSVPMLHATEYFVAVNHPNASDSNDGRTLDHPFKTLGRGVQSLVPGDTLSIKEGVYREPLIMDRSGTPTNRIVIRAYPGDEGEVVIRGSDVVTGWTNDGGDVWSVPWQPLPLIVYPDGWPDFGDYSRRREMVFFDGTPLLQVLSQAELVSGSFWMDDAAERVRIHIPVDPNTSQVEIAVRDQGVLAPGSYNVFHGLRVDHIANYEYAAMHLGPNQTVEDCRVEYNNFAGVKAYSNFVFVRSKSNHNGNLGIALNGNDSLLDSSETSYNSWRYGPTWQSGGIKIVGSGSDTTDNQIVRHTAKYNNGRGVWFDTVGSGNIVEASMFDGNKFIGIEFEAAAGPNWIINNVIVGTIKVDENSSSSYDGGNIVLYEGRDTHIYNNTIVGSGGAGIVIGGGVRDGVYSANTRVFNNIVVDSGTYGVHVGGQGIVREEPIVSSHHFDNNLYHDNSITIRFPKLGTPYSDEYWSLSEWQSNRGEDLSSLDDDPRFLRPSSLDYSLLTDSPAIDSGRYIAEVTEDISSRPRPQDDGFDMGAYECPQAGGCGFIFGSSFERGNLLDWSSIP